MSYELNQFPDPQIPLWHTICLISPVAGSFSDGPRDHSLSPAACALVCEHRPCTQAGPVTCFCYSKGDKMSPLQSGYINRNFCLLVDASAFLAYLFWWNQQPHWRGLHDKELRLASSQESGRNWGLQFNSPQGTDSLQLHVSVGSGSSPRLSTPLL